MPVNVGVPQQEDPVGPFMFALQHVVAQAEHGPASIQAACNAIACVRHICCSPAVRGPSTCIAAFKALLSAVLQLVPKATARPALGLVQLELVLLVQATVPEIPPIFPASDATVHAAPPAGASPDESLTWYAVQQSLLCCMQAFSDLLALPAAVVQHVHQELATLNGTQAIGLLQPGHCMWHVKRLSKIMPQMNLEALQHHAPLTSVEPHQIRWAMVALLVIKSSELQGTIWRLLRQADNGEGMAWIMQVLPRLSWLLVAGESWYCNGLALEGPPAIHLQLPLASWIKVGRLVPRFACHKRLDVLCMVCCSVWCG
eukprot:jgi/Ulvmu1/9267/UM050_0016.1